MKHLVLPPAPSAIMDSLRSIGYSFNTSIADIIDNSIAAGASLVDINFRLRPSPYVAIVDDGVGMFDAVLLEAMRHGGIGPSASRAAMDLGRYGLGLKTASLSQCRHLTVSLAATGHSGASWNLDDVQETDSWSLGILSEEELRAIPHIDSILTKGHGTIVLWEKFDRAAIGERNEGQAIERLVDDSRDHIALVFHRFISTGQHEQRLTIRTNGLEVEAFDPFITTNRRTEQLPTEVVTIDGSKIEIQPYILPHLGYITNDELRRAGGGERLRSTQGFYIYRNRRLIIAGTWFHLIRQDELTKLARVKIDIPNSLDHLWQLDVRKSTAYPPDAVRVVLRRLIDRIAGRSSNVFRERHRRNNQDDILHVWERRPARNVTRYELNREHPCISELRLSLTNVNSRVLERALKAIELALPADAIFADIAADRSISPSQPELVEEMSDLADALLLSVGSDAAARTRLLASLPALEPFSMYPVLTRGILENLRND